MATDSPITGLCIVAGRAPQGYVMIEKCIDRPDEANLWSSGQLFGKKARRFLCITRQFPLENGRLNNVLVSMVLLDEKDQIPEGYSPMTNALDTNEPATCKKIIAVRMVPRQSVREAVCEIAFQAKNRKVTAPFQAVGEVGSLLLVYRAGPVPQSVPSMNFVPMTYNGMQPVNQLPGYPGPPISFQSALPYPISPRVQAPLLGSPAVTPTVSNNATTTASQPIQAGSTPRLQHQTSQIGSVFKSGPLADVPFELNSRLKEIGSFSQMCVPVTVRLRSAADLQQEYNYSFTTEESAAARVVRQ